jgi:hypothetical protein
VRHIWRPLNVVGALLSPRTARPLPVHGHRRLLSYPVAGLSRRRSTAGTLAFLDWVVEETPFAIQRSQTDSGTDFFAANLGALTVNAATTWTRLLSHAPLGGRLRRERAPRWPRDESHNDFLDFIID